jgi:hypothetical protein
MSFSNLRFFSISFLIKFPEQYYVVSGEYYYSRCSSTS